MKMRLARTICARPTLTLASSRAPHFASRRLLCARGTVAGSLRATPSQSQPPPAAAVADDNGDDQPIRLYRFAYVQSLRAFLRVKAVQLVAGVGVLLPVCSVLSSGAMPTLAEGATVAAVTGGTLVAAGTLSWYMERIVGELTWRPRSRSLVVSTLTMLGERRDTHITTEELAADGFIEEDAAQTAMLIENDDRHPESTLVPLEMLGKTYVFVWGRKHVVQLDALADLLVRRQWPRESSKESSDATPTAARARAPREP